MFRPAYIGNVRFLFAPYLFPIRIGEICAEKRAFPRRLGRYGLAAQKLLGDWHTLTSGTNILREMD